MIVVARNVLEDVSKHLQDLEQTSMMRAARDLPGFSAYEATLETQADDSVLPTSEDLAPRPEAYEKPRGT